jgi:hypothetical protein
MPFVVSAYLNDYRQARQGIFKLRRLAGGKLRADRMTAASQISGINAGTTVQSAISV